MAMARISRAMGTEDPPLALFDLARKIGAPVALRDLGMSERDIERAATFALENPYWNPAPLTYDGVSALLRAAFVGVPPGKAR